MIANAGQVVQRGKTLQSTCVHQKVIIKDQLLELRTAGHATCEGMAHESSSEYQMSIMFPNSF